MSEKIKAGITLGDVNGIGPQVVIKALIDNRMTELCTPVIYGSAKVLSFYKKRIEGAENFQYELVKNASEARSGRVNLVNCMDDNLRIEPGARTPEAGKAAVDALETVVADVKAGLIDVIVTAPICKENAQGENFMFPGHTEYFAERFGGQPLMMLCSEMLRVGLVTTHLPISQVSMGITREHIVSQLRLMRHSLIADFSVVEPKIAVLALNPHSGDGGLLGAEEHETIRPAIEEAASQNIFAFGPFAADGFFSSGGYRKYDAVLAMYHDQGLAPFKALSPAGVNFTAGLPVVRTSPDHGVAYDIAGEDKADETSMREAIYMATDILRSRRIYAQITANPLEHYERDKGRDMSVNDLPLQPEIDD